MSFVPISVEDVRSSFLRFFLNRCMYDIIFLDRYHGKARVATRHN